MGNVSQLAQVLGAQHAAARRAAKGVVAEADEFVIHHRVLAQAAQAKGWQVRTAETIGMAQRGGSVVSHVRMGDNGEEVIAPAYDQARSFSGGVAAVCKDGLWGLMRSDGTEVLSCRAPEPLFECDIDEHHWHGYLDGLAWEESDPLEREYNARLKASGDGTLCDAHDGGGYLSFVRLQDNALHIYCGSLGPGELRAPTDADMLLFSGSANGFVPVRDGALEAEGTAGSTTLAASSMFIETETAKLRTNLFTVRQISFLTRRWPPHSGTANGCIWIQRATK